MLQPVHRRDTPRSLHRKLNELRNMFNPSPICLLLTVHFIRFKLVSWRMQTKHRQSTCGDVFLGAQLRGENWGFESVGFTPNTTLREYAFPFCMARGRVCLTCNKVYCRIPRSAVSYYLIRSSHDVSAHLFKSTSRWTAQSRTLSLFHLPHYYCMVNRPRQPPPILSCRYVLLLRAVCMMHPWTFLVIQLANA